MKHTSVLILSLAFLHGAIAETFFNKLDNWSTSVNEAFQFSLFDDEVFVDISGQVDLTGYYMDPEGFYGFYFPQPGRSADFSQRLTLFTDIYIGDNLYGFVKFRWDDGVHPGVGYYYGKTVGARWDEFYLRWSNDAKTVSIQAGQFTPLYGTFLRRQNTWDMGLISYPYLYEGVTSIADVFIPANAAAFANRANIENNPLAWMPIVWAPLYPKGASIFGNTGTFEYALSVLNSAPSSRGTAWNTNDFTNETIIGRLAYVKHPDLQFGINLTNGSYLQTVAQGSLPAGKTINDYNQTNLSFDITYKKRDLQFWFEAFYSRFDIPNVNDDVEIYSYYVESRYDFATDWWLSLRWNHEFYNKIDVGGLDQKWDNAVYRADIGLGYRPARHFQIKTQYSYKEEKGPFHNGEHLFLLESTLRF